MSPVDRRRKTKASGRKTWEEDYTSSSHREAPNRTLSDIPVKPLYGPEDVVGTDYDKDLGFPGQFPYTRGVRASMYRGQLWTMRQFAGFGSAKDTNARFKYLLSKGQTGLSVAFDFPTLLGWDSDSPRSEGEVGRCGVAISSLADMETLFAGIPLDRVSTSMTINGPAVAIWCFYLAVAEKQGVALEKLRGTIQNDILKEYHAQNTWIFPPKPHLRIITDIFAFGAKRVPQWNTVSISGYHIREAGATAVQELAFTLADGFAYLDAGIAAGLDVDDFAPRLSFFFDIHNDFFEEIAKLRAARRIWARTLQSKYKAKDPRSLLLRFHSQTAGCTLTAQQPENNIVRVAYQAMAAVLGGTQSLHTNSMDETLALPTEKSVTIALRTQQVLAHETGVPHTADPLAGSYHMEALTNELERQAGEIFRRIEAEGGMLKAIEKGFFKREIGRSARRQQKEIEEKQRVVVGLNDYVEQDEARPVTLKIDPAVEKRQVASLCAMKAKRNAKRLQTALAALEKGARGRDNVVPLVLEAARSYATLQEICDAMRRVFGVYRESTAF